MADVYEKHEDNGSELPSTVLGKASGVRGGLVRQHVDGDIQLLGAGNKVQNVPIPT